MISDILTFFAILSNRFVVRRRAKFAIQGRQPRGGCLLGPGFDTAMMAVTTGLTNASGAAPTRSPDDAAGGVQLSPREAAILDASFAVFTRYGFARATMDDIAREAGLSRPALYQHYRNKRDIYRAFASLMTWRMTDGLNAMLAAEGPMKEQLVAAYEACVIAPFNTFAATEHGMELLDMKSDLAADIMTAMMGREHDALVRRFLRQGADASTAARLSTLLIDALEGAKARMTGMDAYREAVHSALDLICRLLPPDPPDGSAAEAGHATASA
jgi:AcrR family transcriptional regulator